MKAKILLVDDEENIRFSLKRFLLADGYAVDTAETLLRELEIPPQMN